MCGAFSPAAHTLGSTSSRSVNPWSHLVCPSVVPPSHLSRLFRHDVNVTSRRYPGPCPLSSRVGGFTPSRRHGRRVHFIETPSPRTPRLIGTSPQAFAGRAARTHLVAHPVTPARIPRHGDPGNAPAPQIRDFVQPPKCFRPKHV